MSNRPKRLQHLPLFLLMIAGMLVITSRNMTDDILSDAQRISSPLPHIAEIGIAGSMPGLASDFNILNVFSDHYAASRSDNEVEQQELWNMMALHLSRAQKMDPWFYDTYRLTAALLPYDANRPEQAIDILTAGIPFQEKSWELPFFAAFIAHDMMKDDKLAFKLMQKVLAYPEVPPLAIGLASRFLYAEQGKEGTLLFLQGLLEMMPKQYRIGIEERIRKVREGEYEKRP